MFHRWCCCLLLSLVAGLVPRVVLADEAGPDVLTWGELDQLPEKAAVAGHFGGISNGAFIIAGGSNFPNLSLAEGGIQAKVWHDRIWVLTAPDAKWKLADETLPHVVADGVSVTVHSGKYAGVICIGGGDVNQHYTDVYRLVWHGGKIERSELPPLPKPLAKACGALVGSVIYLAGGSHTPSGPNWEQATTGTNQVWAMNLAASEPAWEEIAPLPGVGRVQAVAATQRGKFLVFSGAELIPGEGGKASRRYLDDAYSYDPIAGWKRLADMPRSALAAPSPAPAIGSSHVLLISGVTADRTTPVNHPGFVTDVLAYDMITNTWARMGHTTNPRIVTPCVDWGGNFVIACGEIHPGIRSPVVTSSAIKPSENSFGWLNYTTLVIYLLGMVGIGFMFTEQSGTDSYFRGSQRIPWWAAGLSIYATMLSSITYMAIPAKAYATDWAYFLNIWGIVAVAPIVIYFYLPFFRQLDVTSAYEYLEKRFNLSTRLLGSGVFIVLQMGRIAIVLCLPAIALATVSSLDLYVCILLTGLLCVIYTVTGGIEAVIWADVVQAIVLLLGAVASLLVIAANCDGGFMGIYNVASADAKIMQALPWSWDHTHATVFVLIGGAVFQNMIQYTASQDVVQRYLTTKDERMAKRSIWTNAIITVPSGVLFYGLGTALYAYYKAHPQRLDPTSLTDAIFPLFIVRELPAGIGGLVVAGVFAAAQSTLASSLNSVATCWITDFHKRFYPQSSDLANLRLARVLTVIVGLVGTLAACLVAMLRLVSLWDGFLGMIGLVGGGLAGIFMLGIFTRRAHGPGVLVGFFGSIFVMAFMYEKTHFLMYAAVGILSAFVLGYLASLVIPSERRDLTGLTLYTLRPKAQPEVSELATS